MIIFIYFSFYFRKSFSKNRAKSANRPKIATSSPTRHNNSGFINNLFTFSPTNSKTLKKPNLSQLYIETNMNSNTNTTSYALSKSINFNSNNIVSNLTNNRYSSNIYKNANSNNTSKILGNFNTNNLNTSLNTSNFFANKNSQNSNNTPNQSKLFIQTENHNNNFQTLNMNMNTLNDLSINNNQNSRLILNNTILNNDKKSAVNTRLNTLCPDETVEEFSKDLENPHRKDSLITRFMKQKKLV